MAALTYNFTDDDNQLWCKCSSGGSASAAWALTIAGLPAGVQIHSITLRFTLGYTYNCPDYAAISLGGSGLWSDYSPAAGARSVDLTGRINGNGAVTLTFEAKAESGERSNVYFTGISLVIDYTNPCSTFVLNKASVDAGSAVVLTISRADASYTHRVTFTLGSRSEIKTDVGTSLSYTIPLAWVDQLPSALSGVCTVTVETISGGVILGAVSAQLTVTVPSSVIPSVGSISTALVDGHNGLYVQGYSRVKVSVSGHEAGTGASLAGVYMQIGTEGVWVDVTSPVVTSGLLRTPGAVTITVTVKDSRGRTASSTKSITVTAYTPVTITGKTCVRCNASGTASPTAGTAAKVGVSYTYSNLSGNAVKVSMYYRKAGASGWTTLSGYSSASGGTAVVLSGSISLDARWEFRFVVADAVSQAEQTAVIPPGSVFMVWSKVKKAFGFGVYPEGEKQIAIAEDWDLLLGGKSVQGMIDAVQEKLEGRVHTAYGSYGAAGYAKIATLQIKGEYANALIALEVIRRGDNTPVRLYIRYQNNTSLTTSLESFIAEGANADYYMFNNGGGLWSLYAKKSGAYDEVCVARCLIPMYMKSRITVTMVNEYAESLPSGYVSAWAYTASIVLSTYPVGSVYISLTATSPASLFGGTWTQITDRFLLGAGASYAAGGTGGEANHKLTTAEMPSHAHGIAGFYTGAGGTDSASYATPQVYIGKAANWDTSNGSKAAGGGGAHNNMPPWYGVYMWRRTA